MKKYARLFKYLRFFNGKIALYFLFTIFSIVFSLVSLGTLPFFLRLIFSHEKLVLQHPGAIHNSADLIEFINYQISNLIVANGANGQVLALGLICITVIVSVFLKNLFLYLRFTYWRPLKILL